MLENNPETTSYSNRIDLSSASYNFDNKNIPSIHKYHSIKYTILLICW